MAENVFDILNERGYIAQTTHEKEIRDLLGSEKVVFYIGFDPTADSLHVGHFLQMMVMAHMQRAGHTPIAIIGGGTAMVGDPSGRTDMRRMLTVEEIRTNSEKFKIQLSCLVDFSEGKAIMVDNADWLMDLKYVDFLREIGSHFSVNRMLTADCFKSRMEKGLSFIEFNYMIMQSYDFLVLYRKYGCKLQLGGDDQWSNILYGADLIRRIDSGLAYGMTFTLLTNSEGNKMGKTASGAVWLSPEKTSPFEFYQYWRNVEDADVIKCLKLLTFVPMDEIGRLALLKDRDINEAKKLLAFEVTKLVHGEEEAHMAAEAASSLFENGGDMEGVPSTGLTESDIAAGLTVLDLLMKTGLTPSRGEARRLIDQNGLSVNGVAEKDMFRVISRGDFIDGVLMLKKGKKTYHKVTIS
jgi:tyrosyl-tRNA synthetase